MNIQKEIHFFILIVIFFLLMCGLLIILDNAVYRWDYEQAQKIMFQYGKGHCQMVEVSNRDHIIKCND